MKKILLVSYYFNLRDTDRAYTAYCYLKKRGYEVKVLCGNYDHNSKTFVTYGLPDVQEIPVHGYNRNISFRRIYSNLKFAWHARRIVKQEQFDIAWVVGPPNCTGYFLKKVIRKKNAIFILDIFDLYPETIPINESLKQGLKYLGLGVWSYLRDASIKEADIFLSECKYYLTRLGLKENDRIKLLPLCKDDVEDIIIPKLSVEEIRIIYLGALTGNYDFEGLINLMVALKEKHKKAKLFIIGDGSKRNWLLEELDNKGIRIEYLGRVYDDSIKKQIFEQCHFGFNGFKENVSIALSYKSMEYMSNGVALINSCKEDTWELINNKNIGINYSCGKIKELAECICQLSAEDVSRMKQAAFVTYKEEYSFSRYSERMDDILGISYC